MASRRSSSPSSSKKVPKNSKKKKTPGFSEKDWFQDGQHLADFLSESSQESSHDFPHEPIDKKLQHKTKKTIFSEKKSRDLIIRKNDYQDNNSNNDGFEAIMDVHSDSSDTSLPLVFLSFYGHLVELHKRLFFCALVFLVNFCVSYYFVNYPLGLLVRPLGKILKELGGRRFIYTHLSEGFLTYIHCAFFSAFILTFPFLLFHLWKFLHPALKRKEKQHVLFFLLLCPLLFALGASLAYFWICPLAWSFFLQYDGVSLGGIPLEFEGKISDSLSMTFHLMGLFGLGFQLPIVVLLLHGLKVVSYETLKKSRGYVLVIITIVAALLTPPDIISPLGLMIPLYGLYEGTLLWLRWSSREVHES